MHAARLMPDRTKRLHAQPFAGLPDGAYVLVEGKPHLVVGDGLLEWSPGGYVAGRKRPAAGDAALITPPSAIEVIAAGFKAELIYKFFEENYHDMNVKIVNSGDVDVIERIKRCSSQIKDDFILLYGDVIANVNLEHLQKFHSSHSSKATITLWPFKSSFGLFELDQDGNAINYREKPTLKDSINIGYFYYEIEILSWIKDFATYAEFLESLVNQRKLKGFMHHGVHLTINTLRELEEAEQVIDKLPFLHKEQHQP